ncbi:hypothetical protein BGZ74_002237 [Mortierella antarctica]|nr:hypothetical protein BGZ74_002237 [Mortierella antarctica]
MPKELILYLEPRPTSELGLQLHQFFSKSHAAPWGKHTHNEALKYPPHITMVGFFNSPSQEFASDYSIEQIIAFLDQATAQISSTSSSSSFPQQIVQGLIRPSPTSLLLAIQPSSALTGLIQHCADRFPELGLRLKKINHLSLSYWDDDHTVSEAELREREQWVEQAQELAVAACPWLTEIPSYSSFCKDVDMNKEDEDLEKEDIREHVARISREHASKWDVVLYEIEGRVRSSSAEYPLVELKRWAL